MPSDTASVRETQDVPATKLRNVRVDDRLWEQAKRIAVGRRETLSAVIKRALVEYVERHGEQVEP